ncbi:hypothetical protein [Erwinia typographi]|uniref:hypothetical protein n=1 Tax=Erwinia typographi TaxID=371042 RepID=UPI0012EE9CEC|nr:hypothetical protein [Erwinia typographi]
MLHSLSQLDEINRKSIEKTAEARKNLASAVRESIANIPEEKENIVSLNESWNATIRKKCRLMILESINTDAEIANDNSCLADEYNSETKFLKDIC